MLLSLKSLLPPVEKTAWFLYGEQKRPTSHPHSVTENKWGWNGGWLALQIISLTQIVECFLHRPGTKSRKYKNVHLCCQHKDWRATFALLAEMKKTPLLWKTWRNTLSLSGDNVSSENEVSSNRPGSRKQQPKVPLANRPLSQFLAITLDINKSSPSLGCKRHSKWFLKCRWTRQRRHTKRHKSGKLRMLEEG